MLYTVWVTIGHMGRVGYMGHGSCCCVHIGHVIPYDATSASSDRVRMAGMLAYIGVGPHVSSVSSGSVRLCREETGRDLSVYVNWSDTYDIYIYYSCLLGIYLAMDNLALKKNVLDVL